jgi:hypothetical protein
MTLFYVLLYYVWRQRYAIKGKSELTATVYALAAVRILLFLFPQNGWISADASLNWTIYRNIPFALLGILVIVLFYRSAKEQNDHPFRHMGLMIVLSFLFYIPVVLFADTIPLTSALIIPKTRAYVWTVLICYNDMRGRCALMQTPSVNLSLSLLDTREIAGLLERGRIREFDNGLMMGM